LRALAQREAEEASHVLRRAWTLREALSRIVHAEMHREAPDSADLALFNDELGEAMGHATLTRDGDAYHLGWRNLGARLEAPLWPVLRSAADLLQSPLRKKIRQCANTPCNWLFIDESKNTSRRWCSMAICGTQVKMRNYYQRKHSQPATA